MKREDLEALIIWTMKNYGSDAREKADPGSRLRSQAKYIADVVEAFYTAQMIVNHKLGVEARHVIISPRFSLRGRTDEPTSEGTKC